MADSHSPLCFGHRPAGMHNAGLSEGFTVFNLLIARGNGAQNPVRDKLPARHAAHCLFAMTTIEESPTSIANRATAAAAAAGDVAADYARLTPVALSLAPPTPTIAWGDLGEVRFSDPFFDQTVQRWAAGAPPSVVRSDLGALAEFDGMPDRDPCGLIFHMSRCGSTLLSRLLGTMPETLMVSEPQPLNALLMGARPEADEAGLAQILRCLVRALGCRRFGERSYLIKLSSWNMRCWRLFRRAFPAARIILVQRAPGDVVRSLRADPPGWLQLRQRPPLAEMLFGIPAADLARLDADAFGARALAAMLAAAAEAADAGALVIDYTELAAAAWTRVAPFVGMNITAHDVARMQDESRFYAKHAGRQLFAGDPPQRRPDDPRLRELAAEIVEPAYRELDRRRQAQIRTAA
jgi:hypothetical protein